jgi:retinoid hydroxylase
MTKAYLNVPGNSGLPYLGETFKIFANQEKYYYDQYLRYGEVSKTRLMGMDFTVLLSPEVNQLVLKDQAYKFSTKEGWSYLEPFFGDSLILQDGSKHQESRKLLYPVFHGAALENLAAVIHQAVATSLSKWENHQSFFAFLEFRSLTLNVASQVILGNSSALDLKIMVGDFIELVDGMKTILRLNVPFTRYGNAQLAKQRLYRKISSLIFERRSLKNAGQIQDVLGLMLSIKDEYGHPLPEQYVRTQILQLLFAGHDTLSFVLSWLMFELCDNPTWKEQLRHEAFGISLDPHTIIYQKLPLTDLVIKEVERLYPPVYFIPRGVLEDFEYEGYHISAGSHVMLSPFVTNRLPLLFKDPHNFDPLRFAPERDESKFHPFAVIPYGAGQHRCLGRDLARLEMKIFLIMFLQKFEFDVSPVPSSLKPVMHPRKYFQKIRLNLSPI